MSRFVRPSKFRHVYGTAPKRDQCYDNLRVSRNAWDTNLVKVNAKFLAVNLETSGGGQFAVIPLDRVGKLPQDMPVYAGHSAAVLDTDFNPFNDYLIASCAEDGRVMVWSIPEENPIENVTTPALTFDKHSRKVGQVAFHPTAENILLSSGADLLVKIYDIQKGQEVLEVTGHMDVINSVAWNWNGSMLATTCKDKKVRLVDVRANKIVQESSHGHQGIKATRVIWCGDSDRLLTTGFSKMSDRQYMLWDSKNFVDPIKSVNLDTSSGTLIPHFDNDTKMLYLAGKGDGNIRYFELEDTAPYIHPLTEYKSSDPLRGLAFMPKRNLNIAECEIARIYKVHPDRVEPISFKVPRKSDQFQADIYPDTLGEKPALSATEWLNGKNASPTTITLEKGHTVQSIRKEFVTHAVVSIPEERDPLKHPQTDKEYQDAFHALRKENDLMKNELAQKDVRLRQLEMQVETLSKMKSGR